jgi:predicted O-methyltransferase YrrM
MKKNLVSFAKWLSPKFQTVHLEYKVNPIPRFKKGNFVFEKLNELVKENENYYRELLESFTIHLDKISEIKEHSQETNEDLPTWNNGYFPGMDIINLYGVIAHFKPKQILEIGSGNSTKVARKAIRENGLPTKITSIDPFPRANIDHLSDTVIRHPLEEVAQIGNLVSTLEAGDILFIDNSHRSLPNSDVTICFLELLPQLKKGVIVHVHDIYIPFEYPQYMCDRLYNEQYFLASMLMNNPDRYKTILPNYYIYQNTDLQGVLAPFWKLPVMQNVEKHGGSYWLRIEE